MPRKLTRQLYSLVYSTYVQTAAPILPTPHMSQIAKNVSFPVLSVFELKNLRCSCDFLEVSQEAKVAPIS